MENYRKGKNVEEELDRNKIPIEGLQHGFLWMKVRAGSSIKLLMTHALKEFTNQVVWSGSGPAVAKVITCAEIMKREKGHQLHQVTKLGHLTVEEYWDPKKEELDPLVVKRKIPTIHILLSSSLLNTAVLGYQAPGELRPFHPKPIKTEM